MRTLPASLCVNKYTDRYDYTRGAYFSLNKKGRILEVNLTGLALFRVVVSLQKPQQGKA